MKQRLQHRSLVYHSDLAFTLFAPLAQTPWAMLLHSGNADHPHNRFDIIVAEPISTLQTTENSTTIQYSEHCVVSTEDPFALIQHELDKWDICPQTNPDLPFQGGALGLWGYDLGRRIESLPCHAEKMLQIPDMAIGIYDWAVIIDHHLQQATLICYHDIDSRFSWLENLSVLSETISSASSSETTHFKLTSDWLSNMTSEEYTHKINKIHEYLRSGDCYQVNLAQRFSAKYSGDEWSAFLSLNENNRAPFSAYLRLPENSVLSISPERFLHLENHIIETRPIKGTLPRLDSPDEDKKQAERLQASKKDRAENLMIVDLMRNDIGRVAKPGSVSVPELFVVEAFPAVHHLVSTIKATLPDNIHPTDLLRACFPGGSITGAPKIRAMEIIEELEPHRRHGYCGAIGYISFCGTMDTNIAIRTLIAEDKQLYCWAGGGIVADSVAESEYQETFDKLNRILPVLQKAD